MAQREWESTTRLIDAAIKILAEQWPMTVRQLFYALVSAVIIQNCLRDYKRTSRAITIARRDDRVPYEQIVDRSRPTYFSSNWNSVAELGEAMELQLQQYRRDYWQDQPTYCEMICEKDALTGSLDPVRREYGLTLEALRGFDSESKTHEVAKRFVDARQDGKKVVVLYLGDWDPSGECIEVDLKDRIVANMRKVLGLPKDARDPLLDIEIRRIAIFKEDIRKFNLPPLKVKDTDRRSAKFVRKHGNRAVELDALPPNELRGRLRIAIESLIDRAAWNRARLVEEAQRATCQRYAGLLRELSSRA
jgi:hypothetical protein